MIIVSSLFSLVIFYKNYKEILKKCEKDIL